MRLLTAANAKGNGATCRKSTMPAVLLGPQRTPSRKPAEICGKVLADQRAAGVTFAEAWKVAVDAAPIPRGPGCSAKPAERSRSNSANV